MDGTSSARARQGAPAWDALHCQQRVQVFGAGRAVGRELIAELLRSGHPPRRLRLYGRRPAAFSWQGETLQVEPLEGDAPRAELAFVCTTRDVGRSLVPRLLDRGTRVIDLSGAASEDPAVPFVVEGVNGDEVGAFSEIAALPCRSALPLIRLLAVLDAAVGLAEVDAFVLVSAASQGARGILALRQELASLGEDPPAALPGPRRVGRLLPPTGEAGCSLELERLIAEDVRRMLHRHDLVLDVLAAEGDAERCDTFAVKARLAAPLAPEDALALFEQAPRIAVEPSEAGPLGAACAGSDRIHVGRIRAGSGGASSLCFFAVADQLRVGAASAAVRVAGRFPASG